MRLGDGAAALFGTGLAMWKHGVEPRFFLRPGADCIELCVWMIFGPFIVVFWTLFFACTVVLLGVAAGAVLSLLLSAIHTSWVHDPRPSTVLLQILSSP